MTNKLVSDRGAVLTRSFGRTAVHLTRSIRLCFKLLLHEPKIWRLASLGVLFIVSLFGARSARALEADTDEPLSVVQQVADEWNSGHAPSAAYFVPSLTIIDDTPPYLFQGPDATRKWMEAYNRNQPREYEGTQTALHLLRPKLLATDGPHAYVAIPAEWMISKDETNGKILRGVITAILQQANDKWRIAVWIWTPE
jgi:hypothetical protein